MPSLHDFQKFAADRGWTVNPEPDDSCSLFRDWDEDGDIQCVWLDLNGIPEPDAFTAVIEFAEQVRAEQIEERRLEPLRRQAERLARGHLDYYLLSVAREWGVERFIDEAKHQLSQMDDRDRLKTDARLTDFERIRDLDRTGKLETMLRESGYA